MVIRHEHHLPIFIKLKRIRTFLKRGLDLNNIYIFIISKYLNTYYIELNEL